MSRLNSRGSTFGSNADLWTDEDQTEQRPRAGGRRRRSAKKQSSGFAGSQQGSASGRGSRGAGQGMDPETDPESVARSIVLQKLTAQARTRDELARALKSKNVPEEVSDSVLDRMEEVGLVDDAEFARGWVSSRQSRRYLSKSALRRELMTKGVERDQIDDALEQVDGADEMTAARALAEKKFRSMKGLERNVQYRRLAGALGRRGFGSSVVSAVLAEVLNTDSGEEL